MKKAVLISYRLKRAKEVFEEAEQIAKMGHWNSSVNRLYYSCFYAVSALLLQQIFPHLNILVSEQFLIRSLFIRELSKRNLGSCTTCYLITVNNVIMKICI